MIRIAPILTAAFLVPLADFASGTELPASLHFEEGPVNTIVVEGNGSLVAINAAPSESECDLVFLTHARRDIVSSAEEAAPSGDWVAPEESRPFLEEAESFWDSWWNERFDYYRQQVTRRPVRNSPAGRYLSDGEIVEAAGVSFRLLATPGYTRDGGTWIAAIDGVRVAFTGELLLAGGRVPDLYSFQNEIPEARVGGYHGYLGRIAEWISSLEALRTEDLDLIVPSRGRPITDPGAAISRGIDRARTIYRNYLSTNALHWYFGEERMGLCAERVLGPDHEVSSMPLAEHVDLPDWCRHIGTTKLLVSDSGAGFVLDVGGSKSLATLRQAIDDGLLATIEGIFATHTHNDHTAAIAEAAEAFDCPVHAVPRVASVLENPGAWFLPGISPNVVEEVTEHEDGARMSWREYTFTFRDFPGQMWNHGALLVERPGDDPVFFIGDSFSPSGIDDYCLMNRNLMREDTGYARCFDILDSLSDKTWLVNQHIPHRFRFTPGERSYLLDTYRTRRELIADFTPWDDPNFAIDENWIRAFPYGQQASPGKTVALSFDVWNHSTVPRTYSVRPAGPAWATSEPAEITLPVRGRGSLELELTLPAEMQSGVHVVTFDVERDDDLSLPRWCEALLFVAP